MEKNFSAQLILLLLVMNVHGMELVKKKKSEQLPNQKKNRARGVSAPTKIISQYGQNSKNSPTIWVKDMRNARTEISRSAFEEMSTLVTLLSDQKGENLLDLSVIYKKDPKDPMFITAQDIAIVAEGIDEYAKNDFIGHCNQFVLKYSVHKQNNPRKYSRVIPEGLCSLINSSYKVGANNIFKLCAQFCFGQDIQQKLIQEPIVLIKRPTLDVYCKMGNFLTEMETSEKWTSMVKFINDFLKLRILQKRVPLRKKILSSQCWKINSVQINPSGTVAVSGGWGFNGNLKIWDIKDNKLIRQINVHSDATKVVVFNKDGKRLLSAGVDGKWLIWDTDTWQIMVEGYDKISDIRSVAFSNDDSMIVVGAGFRQNNLIVVNARSGKKICTLGGHSDPMVCVGFSSDNSKIVSVSTNEKQDSSIKIWDVKTERLLALHLEESSACTVESASDGKWFLIGCRNDIGFFFSFDLNDLKRFVGYDSMIGMKSNIALLDIKTITRIPASRYVAVGCQELLERQKNKNDIMIFDLLTGKHVQTLEGHTGKINQIVCSSDGRTLISGSDDDTSNLIMWPLIIEEEEQVSQLPLNQLGFVYDMCRNNSIGVKKDSLGCMMFDQLPVSVQQLLKECVFGKRDIMDQGFLLTDRVNALDDKDLVGDGWTVIG